MLCCTLSIFLLYFTPDRALTTDEDIAGKGINFQAHPNYGTLLHEKGTFSFSDQFLFFTDFSVHWLYTS